MSTEQQMPRIMKDALAILMTCADIEENSYVPLSPLYLGLECEMGRYQLAIELGRAASWWEVTSETLKLTPLGLEKAKAIKDLLVKAGVVT